MGTLFGVAAALLAVASLITAFKPSLIRQRSRFHAFVICWALAIIATQIGMAFDGFHSWSSALIGVVVTGAIYGIGRFIATARNVAKMTPGDRAKKLGELRREQSATHISHRPSVTRTSHLSNGLSDFEDGLTTMWAGDPIPVEFTYIDRDGERTRRTVDVGEVAFNEQGQFYLRGICRLRNDYRTFKIENIQTKLKTGNKRYDFEEWCVYVLDILPSEGFPKAYFDRHL